MSWSKRALTRSRGAWPLRKPSSLALAVYSPRMRSYSRTNSSFGISSSISLRLGLRSVSRLCRVSGVVMGLSLSGTGGAAGPGSDPGGSRTSVGRAGLEPALLHQELGPKPSASANSAICPLTDVLLDLLGQGRIQGQKLVVDLLGAVIVLQVDVDDGQVDQGVGIVRLELDALLQRLEGGFVILG